MSTCERCNQPVESYPGMVEAVETIEAFVCEECWNAYLETVAEEEAGA